MFFFQIYGNWLFTITSLAFFPIWNMLWSVLTNSKTMGSSAAPKTEGDEEGKRKME